MHFRYHNNKANTLRGVLFKSLMSLGLLCMTVSYAGAAYMCVTPPVTTAYLREMDNQIKVMNELLQNAQCTNASKVTLFGMDFYPDPPDENGEREDLTGDIYTSAMGYLAQAAAVATNEGLGLREFFLSFANTQDSYQLQLDVKQAQIRLDSMKKIMAMAKQACASDVRLEVNGAEVELSQYAETLYFSYRQLYYWLLMANNPSIPREAQDVPDSLLGGSRIVNTVNSLYNQLANVRLTDKDKGKWYAETLSCSFSPASARAGSQSIARNSFDCNVFYTQEYANSLIGQCQSPELNTAGLDSALNDLNMALGEVTVRAEEIGAAATEVGVKVGTDLQNLGNLVTKGDTSPYVQLQLRMSQSLSALTANFAEWMSGSESGTQGQRVVDRTTNLLDANNQPIQQGGISSVAPGATLGEALGQTFTNDAAVSKARIDAQAAVAKQVGDTFNVREQSYQHFIYTNQLHLPQALAKVKSAAEDIRVLCKKHQPRPNEECGE